MFFKFLTKKLLDKTLENCSHTILLILQTLDVGYDLFQTLRSVRVHKGPGDKSVHNVCVWTEDGENRKRSLHQTLVL